MKLLRKFTAFVIMGILLALVVGPLLQVQAITRLHSFTGTDPDSDGATPYGSLVAGNEGLLLGMTKDGGADNFGTIFSYDSRTNQYTVLHSFNELDGKNPTGSLAFQSLNNTVYGMTSKGGEFGEGVLFKYGPITKNPTYSVLVNFGDTVNGILGKAPQGAPTLIGDTLYGVTKEGGTLNMGSLFSYGLDTTTYNTDLYSFGDTGSGVYPEGDLLAINNGNDLYGMTSTGGDYGKGTLFRYGVNEAQYTKLADFGQENSLGEYPYGSLVFLDNILYGMTSAGGGNGLGTIFEYAIGGSVSTIYDFDGINGATPYGSLLALPDTDPYSGLYKLYGVTSSGGDENMGTIFSFTPATTSFELLRSFSVDSGSNPRGSLVNPSGSLDLYGLTSTGGEYVMTLPSISLGTIFSHLIRDTFVDPYSFSGYYNAPLNTDITSNEVQISGINVPTSIFVECGNETTVCSYTGGTNGFVSSGDIVTVTVRSDSSCGSTRAATLVIGSGSDRNATFYVHTAACPTGGGDTTAPTLSQVTGVSTPTTDTTPSYTFNTTEAGTITYGGSCSSGTTSATSGNNTITFNALADGTYSNCTIRVRDSANNNSSALSVNTFVVDTTAPSVSFSIPTTGSSLTVPLTFSATDTNGVTGYKITTSNTPPSSGWSDSAPTEYTFSSYGTKTLYAWATDAVGNVSTENSDTVVLTDTPPADEEEGDGGGEGDNSDNHGGGRGSVRSSVESSPKETPKEAPSNEVVPVQQTEDVVKDVPKKETSKKITTPVVTILDSPIKQRIQRSFTPQQVETIEISIRGIVAGITTLGAAIVLASVLFLNPLAQPEFILIPIRLWTLLLMALGLRKKPTPWGTVYDAITKQPVDPVRVSLVDLEGKEISSAVTDGSGRFGFVAKKGIYKVILSKTNYLFPSYVISQNKMRDEFYENPYFGDYISYDPAVPIQKNIPIDPIDFDTATWAKKNGDLAVNYSKRELVAGQVFNTLLLTTFLIVIASLVVYPEKYNAIIFMLYIAAFVLRRYNNRMKQMGRLYDLYGKPLGGVIIKAYSSIDNRLIKTTKTNRSGRYYLNLPQGLYYIRVERKTTDGLYVPVYSSPELMVRYGTLNKVFNIAY